MKKGATLTFGVLLCIPVFHAIADSTLPLRVMQFNVRNKFEPDPSPHTWQERVPAIKTLINKVDPDIIGTQENNYPQVVDMEKNLRGYQWVGLGRLGGSKSEFMAIYYKSGKFTPLEYDHFWLSDTPDKIGSATWGNRIPRMATWARFVDNSNGKQFYVLNTHFDHESVVAGPKSAELVKQVIAKFNPQLPVIMTGDFNAYYTGDSHQALTGNNGLTDTWSVAKTKINEQYGTFTAFKDPTGKSGRHLPGRGEGDRMDWILYKGNVTVDRVEINTWRNGEQFPSDHYPVIADLQLHYQ